MIIIFIWQRMSLLLQRYNSILISDTFVDPKETPDTAVTADFAFNLCFNPRDLYYWE